MPAVTRGTAWASIAAMIAIVANLPVAEGKETEFETVMGELAQKVRDNEPGCKLYQLCKGQQPGQYVMIERYADKDALTAHGQSDYFKAYFPKLGACLSGKPDIQVFEEVG